MKTLELFYPVYPLIITQPFGVNGEYYRKNGINIIGHNGIDMAASHGQIVRAAHDGIVTFAGLDGSGGWGVVIRTLDERLYASDVAYFKTIYWHLIANIPVKAGQHVSVGDVIGYADNTGLSTGDHLHFGLKPVLQGEGEWDWLNVEASNGYGGAINPGPYWSGEYAESWNLLRLISENVKALSARVKERFAKKVA